MLSERTIVLGQLFLESCMVFSDFFKAVTQACTGSTLLLNVSISRWDSIELGGTSKLCDRSFFADAEHILE